MKTLQHLFAHELSRLEQLSLEITDTGEELKKMDIRREQLSAALARKEELWQKLHHDHENYPLLNRKRDSLKAAGELVRMKGEEE